MNDIFLSIADYGHDFMIDKGKLQRILHFFFDDFWRILPHFGLFCLLYD